MKYVCSKCGYIWDDGKLELTRQDVPDAIWPTDNEWGVPLLDAALQATALTEPITAWGTVARTSKMQGTWHYYVGDYRFDALWDDPAPVVNSGCKTIIEPNFTISPVMPRAVALWHIYRKRWLARYWQSHGISVIVDLNVCEPNLSAVGLLGVPSGWKAYATHGADEYIDQTIHEYELACEHAETSDILFVVYGGGKKAQEEYRKHDWTHIDEYMNQRRNKRHGK